MIKMTKLKELVGVLYLCLYWLKGLNGSNEYPQPIEVLGIYLNALIQKDIIGN